MTKLRVRLKPASCLRVSKVAKYSLKVKNTALAFQLANITKFHETILNIYEVSDFSHTSCQWILFEELGMHCTAAKFVPSLLKLNKKNRVKEHCENDPNFISQIITGDGTWIYGVQPRNKMVVVSMEVTKTEKKHATFRATWNQVASLMSKVLFTKILSHWAKRWMDNFFWGSFEITFNGDGLSCGLTKNGCCITTMHRFIHC